MILEEEIKNKALKLKLERINELNQWWEYRKKFLSNLQNKNLINFLNWKECTDAFVVTYEPTMRIEFDSLDKNYWSEIIKESNTGTPLLASFAPYTSPNMIHYAYHVDVFQKKYDKKIIDYNTIIEFGGGYGGMCRLIRKMGFKGKYILYDLPELNLLQEYYLIKENCMENTVITNNFSIFNDKYDLLIATWSLSEIPLSIREKVAQSAKNFIMASQFEFAGIDNIKYFNSLKLDVFNIEHLPGNFYIMGVNK